MSKCTPKSTAFIYEVERVIDNYAYNYRVYYDAGKYNKRDYVADITVGKNWDSTDTKYLKEDMRRVGATNIIGCVRHAIARDYLDLAFDIKKSKMKELGIDIS